MASHVVVVDSTARRVTVKTNPGTHLSDVRDEACRKLNLNADQYILKRDKKVLDLSVTVRLANLAQGTRLDLVQASRSPTVINVALQLPESDGNIRLTEKFASNTSLWQILRVFESKPPPSTSRTRAFNFTQRGIAEQNGSAGGRMYYAMPVLNIMQRERSTFTELQQTLVQLGFNSGNALIRLSFRNSQQPLEEAMVEISQYFREVDTPATQRSDAHGVHAENASVSKTTADYENVAPAGGVASEHAPYHDSSPLEDIAATPPQPAAASNAADGRTNTYSLATLQTDQAGPIPDAAVVGPGHRTISVFAPPADSTPQAAHQAFEADDYIPTIDHAKRHQARLQDLGRNKRLLSDAELAEQERIREERIAAIPGVTLRVRFPDQSQVEASFSNVETAAALYGFVRDMLNFPDQPFQLRYMGSRGNQSLRDGPEKLVKDLGFQGRMLLNFLWDQSANPEAKRRPPLKKDWMDQAQTLRVQGPSGKPGGAEGDDEKPGAPSVALEKGEGKGNASEKDIESKMRNFLQKSLFKKK